jgi:CRP/FNR family transcriptional regulator, cyclic AMP receptor protein
MTQSVLGRWKLLSPLADVEQRAVVAAARKQSYAKGHVVFNEGDRSDSVHLVVSGHFTVTVSTPDGDHATLAVLGPGQWFGELSQLREQQPTPRSTTIRALDTAQTLMLTQSTFHQVCARHPSVERLVAILMAARIRELNDLLLRSMYLGLDQRVYACLLELAEVYGPDETRTEVPLTQAHLADMAGGRRPAVNQVLQRLMAEGILELGRGRIVLLDQGALRVKLGR